jgi:hypothetical protein
MDFFLKALPGIYLEKSITNTQKPSLNYPVTRQGHYCRGRQYCTFAAVAMFKKAFIFPVKSVDQAL